MSNSVQLPFLENFKEMAKNLKNEKSLKHLGSAQNLLAQTYGFKDYNAIKVKLVEKNYLFNRLEKRILTYKLSTGAIVIFGGLFKTKDNYITSLKNRGNRFIEKEQIEKSLLFIDRILEKRKTVNLKIGSSYTLKHYAEAYIKYYNLFDDYYIPNGAFIIALDMRGYTIRESFDTYVYSLNVNVNCKSLCNSLPVTFKDNLYKGKYDYTVK